MENEIDNKIKITEAARNYLYKKGKREVRIEYPDYRTSCCCAFVSLPEIFAKKPKSEEHYNKITIDGIDVFLSNSVFLPKDNDVVIDVESFLKIKTLKVYGFKLED